MAAIDCHEHIEATHGIVDALADHLSKEAVVSEKRQKLNSDLAIIGIITPGAFLLFGYWREMIVLAGASVKYIGPTVVRIALLAFFLCVCRMIVHDRALSAIQKDDQERTD